MRADDRIDAFASWLVRHGTVEQRAIYSKSVIQGFIAVAAGARVAAEHVERSVRFAREAGIAGVPAMEQLGELFLRFEAELAGETREAAPLALDVSVPDVPPADEPGDAAPGLEPELPPAAMSIRIRAATQPGGGPAPKQASGRTVVLFGVLAAVGGAALVATRLRGGSDDESAQSSGPETPAASPALHLRNVRLSAQFPAGWREATESELGPSPPGRSAVTTAMVFRGARVDDPDEAAYFASMPVSRALAGEPTDAALIEAARTAERGVIAELDAALGVYRSASCEAVTVGGRRAGACRGVAARRGAQAQLHTYVRVIGDRQVVALFLAPAGVAGAAEVPESVVGSLAP